MSALVRLGDNDGEEVLLRVTVSISEGACSFGTTVFPSSYTGIGVVRGELNAVPVNEG